ncbi:MAG: amidohydrolase family protein, partial [Terriglobales bacterium]
TDITRWMSDQPARLAGCAAHKGRLAEGYDADFIILDPEAEFVVSEDRLHYRHPVSAYLGERLRGVVKATYLRGQVVFRDGEFSGEARGREVRR